MVLRREPGARAGRPRGAGRHSPTCAAAASRPPAAPTGPGRRSDRRPRLPGPPPSRPYARGPRGGGLQGPGPRAALRGPSPTPCYRRGSGGRGRSGGPGRAPFRPSARLGGPPPPPFRRPCRGPHRPRQPAAPETSPSPTRLVSARRRRPRAPLPSRPGPGLRDARAGPRDGPLDRGSRHRAQRATSEVGTKIQFYAVDPNLGSRLSGADWLQLEG